MNIKVTFLCREAADAPPQCVSLDRAELEKAAYEKATLLRGARFLGGSCEILRVEVCE